MTTQGSEVQYRPRTRKVRRIVALVCSPCLVFLATLTSSSHVTPSIAEIKSPDLTLILQRLEDIQHHDPAQSRPYELTREYKVFHGSDKKPISEVMAQINFVPPHMKTYKIIQARGNSRGAKMVRELLDRETESAKKGQASEVNRTNYDFVFLRQENFGAVPEYVLGILPKRKDKNLLRGQIWVDASTFRIRRIEGLPAKSPSFWLKNIHITLQFTQVGGMWVPVTFDAIATVRLLGQYTLAGVTIRSSESLAFLPNQLPRKFAPKFDESAIRRLVRLTGRQCGSHQHRSTCFRKLLQWSKLGDAVYAPVKLGTETVSQGG